MNGCRKANLDGPVAKATKEKAEAFFGGTNRLFFIFTNHRQYQLLTGAAPHSWLERTNTKAIMVSR